MDKVKVGIVGIGWWSDVLAGVIVKSDKLDLRACFTRSEDKAADFAAKFHCEAVESYQAMLALDDVMGDDAAAAIEKARESVDDGATRTSNEWHVVRLLQLWNARAAE